MFTKIIAMHHLKTAKKYLLFLNSIYLITLFSSGIYCAKNIDLTFTFDKNSNYSYIDYQVTNKKFIKDHLKNNSNTFNLFSHGRSGELLINRKWLGAKQIAGFLQSNQSYLNSNAKSLNIYGCEFAKGEKGLAAVAYLEKALGLIVNASTNITGKDGDWFLEVGNYTVTEIKNYNYNLQTCPNGTVSEEQYVTSAVGNANASWGSTGGVVGAPDIVSAATDVVANRVSINNTTSTDLEYADTFTGGAELSIEVRRWSNTTYTRGFTISVSEDDVTYTTPSAEFIPAAFAAGDYETVNYTIPAALTGNYKYIRLTPAGGTASLLLIDAVQVQSELCVMYQAEVFNDAGLGGGVYDNGIKDGTEGATGLPTGLFANVVDGTNAIVFSAPVAVDGTYNIRELADGNYTIVLADNETATSSTLPNLWSNSNSGTGTYAITVASNTVTTPSAIPALGMSSCEFGTVVEDQYATGNTGGRVINSSDNAVGPPNGYAVQVYNSGTITTEATVLSYDNTFTGGSAVSITAKHYHSSFADGVYLQYSEDGTTWTASDPTLINGFNSTTYTTVDYTIPASRTGNYKYIRILGNSTQTRLDIDAVRVKREYCNNCNAGVDAPMLSAISISNLCPASTVDLTTITVSNQPANTTLEWHTGSPATNANKIANPSQAVLSEGDVFYASFLSTTDGCYSGNNGDGTAVAELTALLDSDCDGIANSSDLDDDNDGILDVDEDNITCSNLNIDGFVAYQYNSAGSTISHHVLPMASNGDWSLVDDNGIPVQSTDATVSGLVSATPMGKSSGAPDVTTNRDIIRYDGYVHFPPALYGTTVQTRFKQTSIQVSQIWWVISPDDDYANWMDPISITTGEPLLDMNNTVVFDGPDQNNNSDDSRPLGLENHTYVRGAEESYVSSFVVSETGHAFAMGMRDPIVQYADHTFQYSTDGGTTWVDFTDANFSSQAPTCTELKDTDSDGIPDYLDLDSDGDGCPDAIEGAAGFANSDLVTSTINGGSTNVQDNLGNTIDVNGVPTIANGGQEIGNSQDISIQSPNCTGITCLIDGTTGTALTSSTGISTLKRTKIEQDYGWPHNINNGYLVLESKDKGLVVTRLSDPELVIQNPIKGMLVYDTDDKCLKMYNGTSWGCLKQSCPE